MWPLCSSVGRDGPDLPGEYREPIYAVQNNMYINTPHENLWKKTRYANNHTHIFSNLTEDEHVPDFAAFSVGGEFLFNLL